MLDFVDDSSQWCYCVLSRSKILKCLSPEMIMRMNKWSSLKIEHRRKLMTFHILRYHLLNQFEKIIERITYLERKRERKFKLNN